jgi:sulfoxide reductase heme-binding subunit YedZ
MHAAETRVSARAKTADGHAPRRWSAALPSLAALVPWRDRRGRVSALRIIAFALALTPAVRAGQMIASGALGPEPLQRLMDLTGNWAVILLLVSLALTPLKTLTGWSEAVGARRMIGLAGFACLVAHFSLYGAVQEWRAAVIAAEIVKRPYLTIGAGALIGLGVLAATSFDGVIRRMGPPRWRRLHGAVYLLAPLGLVHVWMQVRLADYLDALAMSAVLGFLLAWRVARIDPRGARGPAIARGLALAMLAAIGAALGEAVWLALQAGAPPLAVLGDNFTLEYGPSIAVKVLLITAGGVAGAAALGALSAAPWVVRRLGGRAFGR